MIAFKITTDTTIFWLADYPSHSGWSENVGSEKSAPALLVGNNWNNILFSSPPQVRCFPWNLHDPILALFQHAAQQLLEIAWFVPLHVSHRDCASCSESEGNKEHKADCDCLCFRLKTLERLTQRKHCSRNRSIILPWVMTNREGQLMIAEEFPIRCIQKWDSAETEPGNSANSSFILHSELKGIFESGVMKLSQQRPSSLWHSKVAVVKAEHPLLVHVVSIKPAIRGSECWLPEKVM